MALQLVAAVAVAVLKEAPEEQEELAVEMF
jgi:hypothetical protein